MKAVKTNVNDLDWQPAVEYPDNAEEKVLSQGDTVAPRAILLRIPSGWNMNRHSHRYAELHYVLEGSYESQGDVYSAGTFRMIPREVEHGPFSSRNGATILVVWCALID
jgi:anti-sigma factor ChrR (cupin superfamily)